MIKKTIKFIMIIFLIILIILTIYKLYDNHKKKLYNVLYSEIEYASKRCFLEKKCKNKFTLQTLYDNKYLEKEYDPMTKEELDNNIKITIKKDKVIIENSN